MRRFPLLAALMGQRPERAGSLLEQIRARRAARLGGIGDGSVSEFDAAPVPLALPPDVVLESDLAWGQDPAQRLDLYRPTAADGAALILYVHGGGWQRGDKAMPQMVRHKAPHWTTTGRVFVSINYRMLPDADVLAQSEDLGRALAFVQRHAPAWGADPTRIAVVGHSAGAHLAALLTADVELAASLGAAPWAATVALDSAALDMVAVMNRPHYRFYDPVFGSDPLFWQQASPLHRLHGRPAAPMLLVGSSLREDSMAAAQSFAAKAHALGGQVQVLPVPLTHRAINDELGLPGAYTDAVDAFLETAGV